MIARTLSNPNFFFAVASMAAAFFSLLFALSLSLSLTRCASESGRRPGEEPAFVAVRITFLTWPLAESSWKCLAGGVQSQFCEKPG